MNGTRYNSSSTEAGVLVAIAGHGPTPPVGCTCYHRREITQSPPLLYPQEKRDSTYLSGGFSSMYSWCPPGEEIKLVKHIIPQYETNFIGPTNKS
ncbi:hypothetical protein AVEN_3401-1 [Araneus ventricosus]|uniref:Uncharacterized protein n=1 Tax=Araneus ventricosus TaxID=182803 RepID=A0A4Y2RJV7_ARAVE|nr:hypothetical protein AVEN_170736-1 [Araneus ventricosus]GBN75709.1 hypothetical protein AVEN_3401-1 [Araneus ventricosus]